MADLTAVFAWLNRRIDAAPEMTTLIAQAMGDVVKAEVRHQLSRSQHPYGTPTPSAPGTPPSMISGALANSVVSQTTGEGRVEVGATTPYARIQQLGGASGRGGRTQLPARPYLEPAWDAAAGEAYDAAIRVINEEVHG